ncbi:HET-domain-containing protein [Apiospora arundinis]|uniref:HET-domain-containing protein n=1 Tax=Apiospora arundinis TaxID=335852 RepID=A0ABR2I008_9PEZI
MRLQPWTTRLRRRNTASAERATGMLPPEVQSHLYSALASLYKSLDESKQEFRTVTVAAGRFEDPITCELEVASLLDKKPFEALSYAWGDNQPSWKVFINGTRHEVSQNLDSALRHLRYKDRPRVLWVDALCINQTDIEERNSQVKQMGTIYKMSSQVLAWLGPEYNNSDMAFDFFETMPGDPEMHWDPTKYPEIEEVYTLRHTIAVNDLFDRSWWHRVWTVQESVLCPKLRFVCGARQLPAEEAFRLGECYFKHLYTCCQDIWYTRFKSTAGQPGLGDVCTALAKLEEMRVTTHRYRFGQILSKFMSRHCSDPHDKVYALLGFADQNEASLINPDYAKPVAKLYEEVAFGLIQLTKDLEILCMRLPDSYRPNKLHGGFTMETLPTWVPNWSLDWDSPLLHDLDDRLSCLPYYSASKNSRYNSKSAAQGLLPVRALFIDHVAILSEDKDHMDAPNLRDFFQNWRDMLGITKEPGRLYARSSSTTVGDAFWQTLCCGLVPDREEPRNNARLHRTSDVSPHKSWFTAWWEWCEEHACDPHQLMSIQSDYSRAEINVMGGLISTSIKMRRLFTSDNVGWIGLAPLDTIIGDKIALLEGGRIPYILRPINIKGSADALQRYHLVGAAYVHGVMDGSEWKHDELEDIVLA